MSETDLGPGTRWGLELAKSLESTNFGVICLAPETLYSNWMHFESGALAKALNNSYVCPYLIGVDHKELTGPLSQFNAVVADEKGTFQLVSSINQASGAERLSANVLADTFEKWWPDLKRKLSDLGTPPPTSRLLGEPLSLGVEYIGRTRGDALREFRQHFENEIERYATAQTPGGPGDSFGINVVGTSMRGFLVIFDNGREIVSNAIEKGCPIRFTLTAPEVADRRGKQENRTVGEIAQEVRGSVKQLKNLKVPRDCIKYCNSSPTVWGVATSSYMLLNPYPAEEEAHTCFSMIVRNTEAKDDIYAKYRLAHFDSPWNHGQEVPDSDWEPDLQKKMLQPPAPASSTAGTKRNSRTSKQADRP